MARPFLREPRRPPRTRRKAQRPRALVVGAVRLIPAFLRLLAGLVADRRVPAADKLLFAAVVAYVAMPADLILDYLPFLGMVDDLFLLTLTVRRLIRAAGYRRAMRHWSGSPRDLRRLPIDEIILACAMFLPRAVRRRLERR